ncbi:helix-turn-helix domain-containing protein [Paenibacillus fonticola]|uniref:helix-turn-helix domain-containing protein n=1 Tax=Paenibacillus fonticola TaxID=379896 RepID=UPI0003685ABD|nr:helix-turn-helix domain-containing protein [Paenibacillus fonticola]
MIGLEDAIRAIVAEEVAAAEHRILASLPSYTTDRTLDVREAAELLGVSKKLIYRMCQEGSIPHERFGISGSRKPAIKFRSSDLEAWRAEQRAANYKKGR